jgi:hypothetical protein
MRWLVAVTNSRFHIDGNHFDLYQYKMAAMMRQ